MIINEVILLTSKLQDMLDFYHEKLELKVIEQSASHFIVLIGRTKLTFKQAALDSSPFYHYAINIPENKYNEAIEWAMKRVTLNNEEGDYEVFFKNWNAHAVYFDDPSGNIVELIARHNLNNGTDHEFTSGDLLSISEIGIVTDDVIPFVRKLNTINIPNWKEGSEGFTPLGDEEGLLIIVKNNRKWFFSEKHAKYHPVEVVIKEMPKILFKEINSFETEKDNL